MNDKSTTFIHDPKELGFTSLLDAINFVLKYKASSSRRRTIITYRSQSGVFVEWLKMQKIDDIYIEEFTIQRAQEFMDYLTIERGLSNRTHKNYLLTMRTFFNVLQKRQYISTNPFKNIDLLPQEETSLVGYTVAEINRVKKYLLENDPKMWLVCQFVFYCFIRPNEIVGLQVKHLDIDRGVITIPANISKNRRQQVVTIPDAFKKDLETWDLSVYPPSFYLVGQNLNPSETAIYSTRLAERFKKHMELLEIDNTLYSFKHTGCGMAIQNGISTWDIKNQLRHHSLEQVEKYLARFTKIASDKLVTRFPEI